jgi:hypothetical protein
MAEAAAGAVSWSEVPAVAEQRMMTICWIWQALVPLYKPAITPAIAAELWAVFRARCHVASHGGGPLELPMEVQAMQRWTNELWFLHIQSN